jgi:hypothetical protein
MLKTETDGLSVTDKKTTALRSATTPNPRNNDSAYKFHSRSGRSVIVTYHQAFQAV